MPLAWHVRPLKTNGTKGISGYCPWSRDEGGILSLPFNKEGGVYDGMMDSGDEHYDRCYTDLPFQSSNANCIIKVLKAKAKVWKKWIDGTLESQHCKDRSKIGDVKFGRNSRRERRTFRGYMPPHAIFSK